MIGVAVQSFLFHFVVSFVLVLGLTIILGRRGAVLSLLVTLLIGVSKEVFDINVNTYNMAPDALLLDCLGDLLSDFVGAFLAYLIVREKKNSQAWYWTKEWQEGEREAQADIEAGRVKKYDSVKDFLASLDEEEKK